MITARLQAFTHIAVALLAVILTIIFYQSCGKTPCPAIAKTEYSKKSDTSNKEITFAPVKIEATAKITPRPRKQIAAKLPDNRVADSVELPDNVVANTIEPFTASLDTVAGKDTLSVAYDFPENRFRVAFKRAADSVQVINTTETITHYISPPWYEKPSFTVPATAGTIIAILLLVR